jgi:hypothetical protein
MRLAVLAVLAAVVAWPSSIPGAGAAQSRTTWADAPRIIIDTDLSLWWDDATAVGMANVLEQRGAVRLLGVVSDIRNPLAVAAIDAIDTATPTSLWVRSPTAPPTRHRTATPMCW